MLLTKIDDLQREDHWYLTPEDSCWFLGEYTARAGYQFSTTNSFISNLKKPMSTRGQPQWLHKERAIQEAAQMVALSIGAKARRVASFVPVPPSRARSDPAYDDRLTRVLRQVTPAIDVRELVEQFESIEAAHTTTNRPTPASLQAIYRVAEECSTPAPRALVIFDDVLTTGAHFIAMKASLQERFGTDVPIIGLFLARRAIVTQ